MPGCQLRQPSPLNPFDGGYEVVNQYHLLVTALWVQRNCRFEVLVLMAQVLKVLVSLALVSAKAFSFDFMWIR